MNNPFNLIQMYQQLRQNPMQMLSKRFNIPQGMDNPEQIIQHLLNSGQITQQQVNNVMSMRSNPQIQQMFNMK